MLKNETKAKIKAGGVAVGTFLNVNHPRLVELCGYTGYDFAIFDAEHGPADYEVVEGLVRAAELTGITPLVRIAQNVPQVILRYLDEGCLGAQIPMVNTRADAEAVVKACKYPPAGIRGLAGVRPARYGVMEPMPQYVDQANEEVMVIVQAETMQAANNLAEILAVPGIDVIFIGPTDLASSMGYKGDFNRPEVQDQLFKMIKQIRDAGVAPGTLALGGVAGSKNLVDAGVQYLVPSATGLMVAAGRQFLKDIGLGRKPE
ncbi:MAG: aldolase/citrate lyase family protein [Chloroflexi bacterium]|nr:aldolase/citrate lyase family protein [Chloroflexota bacterium]MCL5107841.1 aldolase/citrate lyase family protein [Chloroflexota bacterium]